MIEKTITEFNPIANSTNSKETQNSVLKSSLKSNPSANVIEEKLIMPNKVIPTLANEAALSDLVQHEDAPISEILQKSDQPFEKSIPLVNIGKLDISLDDVIQTPLHKDLPSLPLTAYTSLDGLSSTEDTNQAPKK